MCGLRKKVTGEKQGPWSLVKRKAKVKLLGEVKGRKVPACSRERARAPEKRVGKGVSVLKRKREHALGPLY